MNVHTGSTPSGISYMQAPAYPNLMDINSTIKGTMQELLKEHHQQIPINKPVPPANNPLNRFENTHQQTYPLGDILDEIKKEPRNSFEGYDDGSPINSEDYENDDPASFFLKPGKEIEGSFGTPLKLELSLKNDSPIMRKSQLPLRKTPFKSFSEEKPKHEYYIGSEYKPENDEEKEQNEIKKTQQQYAKNRAERIRSANLKGTKIKPETLKKYNITFNSNTGKYE